MQHIARTARVTVRPWPKSTISKSPTTILPKRWGRPPELHRSLKKVHRFRLRRCKIRCSRIQNRLARSGRHLRLRSKKPRFCRGLRSCANSCENPYYPYGAASEASNFHCIIGFRRTTAIPVFVCKSTQKVATEFPILFPKSPGPAAPKPSVLSIRCGLFD